MIEKEIGKLSGNKKGNNMAVAPPPSKTMVELPYLFVYYLES